MGDNFPKDGNGYPTAALFTDAKRADPIVIFPNDACASLADAHPMLATTYLEMLLATCGHERSRPLHVRVALRPALGPAMLGRVGGIGLGTRLGLRSYLPFSSVTSPVISSASSRPVS